MQVLKNLMRVSGELVSGGELVQVVVEHCSDPSLAVSKQVVVR